MATESVTNEQAEMPATMDDYASHSFEALLTKEQFKKAEEHFQSIGLTRRLAHGLLTRSKQELMEGFAKNAELAGTLQQEEENLTGYIEHLETHKEIMEIARVRMLCVLATIATTCPDIANSES